MNGLHWSVIYEARSRFGSDGYEVLQDCFLSESMRFALQSNAMALDIYEFPVIVSLAVVGGHDSSDSMRKKGSTA
jgi:hypothetical protein